MQIWFGLMASLFFLVVYLLAKPYERHEAQTLQVMVQLQVTFNYMTAGLLFFRDPLADEMGQVHSTFSDVLLVSANAGCFFTLAWLAYTAGRSAMDEIRQLNIRLRDGRLLDHKLVKPQSELGDTPVHGWHLFLSHQWTYAQDQVSTIKGLLGNLNLGFKVFLDVDDLESLDLLEEYIERSDVILVFATELYTESTNCQREVVYAKKYGKPIIVVYETARLHGRERHPTKALVRPSDHSNQAKLERGIDNLRLAVRSQLNDRAKRRRGSDGILRKQLLHIDLAQPVSAVDALLQIKISDEESSDPAELRRSEQLPDDLTADGATSQSAKGDFQSQEQREAAAAAEAEQRERQDAMEWLREEIRQKKVTVLPWFRERHLKHACLSRIVRMVFEVKQEAAERLQVEQVELAKHSENVQSSSDRASSSRMPTFLSSIFQRAKTMQASRFPLFVSDAYGEALQSQLKKVFEEHTGFTIVQLKSDKGEVKLPALMLLTEDTQGDPSKLYDHLEKIVAHARNVLVEPPPLRRAARMRLLTRKRGTQLDPSTVVAARSAEHRRSHYHHVQKRHALHDLKGTLVLMMSSDPETVRTSNPSSHALLAMRMGMLLPCHPQQ